MNLDGALERPPESGDTFKEEFLYSWLGSPWAPTGRLKGKKTGVI